MKEESPPLAAEGKQKPETVTLTKAELRRLLHAAHCLSKEGASWEKIALFVDVLLSPMPL